MGRGFFRCLVLLTALIIVFAGVQGVQAQAASSKASMKYAPAEILVKFKDSHQGPGPVAKAVNRPETAVAALSAQAQAALGKIGAQAVKHYGATGVLKVKVPQEVSMAAAIDELYRSGTVKFAEPNFRVQSLKTPIDPKFPSQWSFYNRGNIGSTGSPADADIDAPEAWNVSTNGANAIVVVIDTGINYAHPDLAANMWKNPQELAGTAGLDDDGNGYIDDIYGIDAYNGTSDPDDDHGHGSHVAGIIGARAAMTGTQVGVAGICWSANIMALKALDEEGWGWVGDVIECINYALNIKKAYQAADPIYKRMVINVSWGSQSYSSALYDAILEAQNQGVLVVAAAGNDNLDISGSPWYPAAYELQNIISVGASNIWDNRTGFSNWGFRSVDLFAPGENILSTSLANAYVKRSGTSQAAAHVTGAAALAWSKYTTNTWDGIKGLILNGAENGVGGGFGQACITEGRLNVFNTVYSSNVDDPCVLTVTPSVAEPGSMVTLAGFRFGTEHGEIKFVTGGTEYIIDDANVTSWSTKQIVVKIPADCPKGWGRIILSTSGGISRGACCGIGVDLQPEVVGQTILGHAEAAYAQIGNSVWIISGRSDWGQTALMEKFNLETLESTFNPLWMMPKPVLNAGAAAVGDKVYVVGGIDDVTKTVSNKLLIFDTTNGIWTRGRNFPLYVYQPTVVSYANKVWVFGGRDPNNKALRTLYMYDPTANTWIKKAPPPAKAAYAASAFVNANTLWLMGGYSEDQGTWFTQDLVQEYNFSNNSWTSADELTRPRGGSAGIDIQNVPFCIGGTDSNGRGEYFFGGVWNERIGSLPWSHYTPIPGKLGNKIFLINGIQPWGPLYHNVWRFNTPAVPATP
jgi:subtilisin family serine protease